MEVLRVLKERRSLLLQRRAENSVLERQAVDAEDRIIKAAEELKLATEGLEFLEEVANSRRGSMKGRIESVLTEALVMVYGPGRKVELTYTVKNNRSHLAFEIVKESKDGEVRRRIDGTGCGLGVSDVVSVPLRLLVMLGSKQTARICVLDECYKHMNPGRVPLVAEFLKTLCGRLGIQIILLSHHERIQSEADVVFQVSLQDEKSVVEKVV